VKAIFEFKDEERFDWHFIPKTAQKAFRSAK